MAAMAACATFSRATFPLPVPTHQWVCTRRFLPEVERASCLVSRLAFPPNLVPRHSHLNVCRPRPSRAISQSFVAMVVHQPLFYVSPMNLRRYARGNEREPTRRRNPYLSLLQSSTVRPFHSLPVSSRGLRFL
ncbi:hypothetical protein DFH94DRAFT_755876 [Russula ochroleuca]|uniref:Uncharacterized protein n=1 Tax=Russula ochroleuca TaxID=152965 RepID=A0A9P5MSR1_9AGAM|nr:hypothetical protein DFH94DRAFT_755876 [Russula ochroleuca]